MLAHTSVVYHMSYITKFLVTQQLNNSSTSLGDSVRVREREREREQKHRPLMTCLKAWLSSSWDVNYPHMF